MKEAANSLRAPDSDLPKIWTSDVWFDPIYSKLIKFPVPDDFVSDLEAYKAGGKWDRSVFPDFAYYWRKPDTKNLPEIFTAGGGTIFISERLADLLQSFDLGQTQMHKVEMRRFDKITPLGVDRYLLNIAEHKDCFVREATTSLINQAADGHYYPVGDSFDGIAVRASAAEGADLWMAPNLEQTPFFSDRLAQAIKKGKFGRTGLTPCIVVE